MKDSTKIALLAGVCIATPIISWIAYTLLLPWATSRHTDSVLDKAILASCLFTIVVAGSCIIFLTEKNDKKS